jgi:hypothetical protein
MFEYCPLIEKKCGFCTLHKEEHYCGLSKGSNPTGKVKHLKKCPKKGKNV